MRVIDNGSLHVGWSCSGSAIDREVVEGVPTCEQQWCVAIGQQVSCRIYTRFAQEGFYGVMTEGCLRV
ncbi:hypothetical protein J8J32_21775, partial [Mycobacterium tuberculosis]|uniref:hypothetical protein n=1 Tax=Mycobacterium tuberculosis TaxID=1773 RepID=UPI001AE0E756